jgi:hypothetical protein
MRRQCCETVVRGCLLWEKLEQLRSYEERMTPPRLVHTCSHEYTPAVAESPVAQLVAGCNAVGLKSMERFSSVHTTQVRTIGAVVQISDTRNSDLDDHIGVVTNLDDPLSVGVSCVAFAAPCCVDSTPAVQKKRLTTRRKSVSAPLIEHSLEPRCLTLLSRSALPRHDLRGSQEALMTTLIFYSSLLCPEWLGVRSLRALLLRDTHRSCAEVLCRMHAVDGGREPDTVLQRVWANNVHPDRISATVRFGVHAGWYPSAEADRLVAFSNHCFMRLRKRKPSSLFRPQGSSKCLSRPRTVR